MANPQNLIPQAHKLTVEEQSRAGKRSGEVRRARKQFKESFIDELSQGTTQEEIVRAILEKATQGDIQCATFIRDTIGEKPTDKVETKGEQKIVVEMQGDLAEWSK
jgi:hypothetical protein